MTQLDKNLGDTTPNELKEVGQEKLEELQERAERLKDESLEHVNDLSTNQKLFVTGGITLVVSVLVNAVIDRIRYRNSVVLDVVEVDDEPTAYDNPVI